MEKMTKKNVYTALINFAETGVMNFENKDGVAVEVTPDALREFAINEIGLIDKKAAKAKETAAKKRAEGDALIGVIEAALTDEFKTIADIAAGIEDEEATVAKVTYRLNKLVEDGVAEKTDLKVAEEGKKTRTVKAYKLA